MAESPSPKIVVPVNDSDREFFMSFGLLHSILKIVPNFDDLGMLYTDPEVIHRVLTQLLAERAVSGKVKQWVDVDDVQIETKDVQRLLNWTGEHLSDFFIRAYADLTETTGSRAEELQKLVSSVNGLQASHSATG